MLFCVGNCRNLCKGSNRGGGKCVCVGGGQIFRYCLLSGYLRSYGPRLSSQLGKKIAFLAIRHCSFKRGRDLPVKLGPLQISSVDFLLVFLLVLFYYSQIYPWTFLHAVLFTHVVELELKTTRQLGTCFPSSCPWGITGEEEFSQEVRASPRGRELRYLKFGINALLASIYVLWIHVVPKSCSVRQDSCSSAQYWERAWQQNPFIMMIPGWSISGCMLEALAVGGFVLGSVK